MAKDAVLQFEQLRKLLDDLNTTIKSSTVVGVVARKTRDQVQKRTRAGFGISSDDPKSAKLQKLKRLEPSTKRRRKSDAKKGILSSKTQPAKANLTRTGNLIDDLEIKQLGKSSFRIKPAPADQNKANKLDQIGYKFLGLTKKELGLILKDSFGVFQKIINKLNNV